MVHTIIKDTKEYHLYTLRVVNLEQSQEILNLASLKKIYGINGLNKMVSVLYLDCQ